MRFRLSHPFKVFHQTWNQPADPWGLALFRVFYAGLLLLEVIQIFRFRELIFSGAGLPPGLIPVLLVLWALALVLLGLGWHTRKAAFLNYLLSITAVWLMPQFKYHLDYLMTGVNFLLLWLPVSAALSLDARSPGNRQAGGSQTDPARVNGRYLFLIAWLPLGLVYLDSVFYKFSSQLWLDGLGFWAPSSMPQNAQTDLTWLLNQEMLVKGIGYGIMVFEAAFLLLIWFRPLRGLVCLAGIGLHLGIAVAYPIPHFGGVMAALYLPLLPRGFWVGLRRLTGQVPVTGDLPASSGLIKRNRFKESLLAVFVIYTFLGQLMCMLVSPLAKTHLDQQLVQPVLSLYRPFFYLNQKFLGLVPHDIFLDQHFAGYRQMYTLVGEDAGGQVSWPLLDPAGQPASGCSGRIWNKWVYRVNGPGADTARLKVGLNQFAAAWPGRNFNGSQPVKILLKKVSPPLRWEKDFLARQKNQPWRAVGEIRGLGLIRH